MSQTLSPSSARCYGLARVARVWSVSRASVYCSLKETPPNTIAHRIARAHFDNAFSCVHLRGDVRSCG